MPYHRYVFAACAVGALWIWSESPAMAVALAIFAATWLYRDMNTHMGWKKEGPVRSFRDPNDPGVEIHIR